MAISTVFSEAVRLPRHFDIRDSTFGVRGLFLLIVELIPRDCTSCATQHTSN